MSRSLFIGDSHTCGYWSHPTERGPGSYTYWNDNNYSESYAKQNNKPVPQNIEKTNSIYDLFKMYEPRINKAGKKLKRNLGRVYGIEKS